MDPQDNQDNSTQGQTEEQTSVATQTDTVDIHEATRDEVKNALASAIEAENQQRLQQGASTEGESAGQTESPASTQNDNSQNSQTSGQSADANQQKPKGQASATTSTQQPAATGKPAVQSTQATEESGTVESRRELFVQQRKTALNTYKTNNQSARSVLQTKKAELENGLTELYQTDTQAAIGRQDQIKDINARLEQIDRADEYADTITESQIFFAQQVDPSVTADDIIEVLKSDGVPAQYIAAFQQNPHNWTTPEALVQYGRRAMERKEHAQVRADNQTLAAYCLSLEKQVEGLKKRPGQVITEVQKRLNAPTPVTGQSNASGSMPVNIDVTKMSREELKQGIKAGNVAH